MMPATCATRGGQYEAFGRALRKHAPLLQALHQEADIFDESAESDIPF